MLAIPVGQPTRLPDVELLSLDAPTFGIAGKSVRIPFTLESSLPRDYVATAVLSTSEGEKISKDLRVAAMVKRNGQPIGTTTLAYAGKPSQFTGQVAATRPGAYEVVVYAHDRKSGSHSWSMVSKDPSPRYPPPALTR